MFAHPRSSGEAKATVMPIARAQPREKTQKPLRRTVALARSKRRARPMRRAPISLATPEQKAAVEDRACIVFGDAIPCAGPIDPAHLVDRSLAPRFGDDPLIVVPLCRAHHDAYDNHELDLTPHLEPQWREHVARAVLALGLHRAFTRLTGRRGAPIEAPTDGIPTANHPGQRSA